LGNPEEYAVYELANKIRIMINSKSEIVYKDLPKDDPVKRRPDISKAKTVFNWEPKVSLEEGLKETIKYYANL